MRDLIERLFPALQESPYEITSAADGSYNCVAWAAGDVRRWWWPGEAMFTYWPAEVIREQSIASFVMAFETLGYLPAARQLADGAIERFSI